MLCVLCKLSHRIFPFSCGVNKGKQYFHRFLPIKPDRVMVVVTSDLREMCKKSGSVSLKQLEHFCIPMCSPLSLSYSKYIKNVGKETGIANPKVTGNARLT